MAPVTVDMKTGPHQVVQKMYLAYVFVRLGSNPVLQARFVKPDASGVAGFVGVWGATEQ